jgi:hypothetical protein
MLSDDQDRCAQALTAPGVTHDATEQWVTAQLARIVT